MYVKNEDQYRPLNTWCEIGINAFNMALGPFPAHTQLGLLKINCICFLIFNGKLFLCCFLEQTIVKVTAKEKSLKQKDNNILLYRQY